MKTTKENLIKSMDDQPAKPMYIKEQHNHNCQQFFGPVTGCVFAMPGANVYQTPSGVEPKASVLQDATCNPQFSTENVLEYVMRLYPSYISKEWQAKYRSLWEMILELPEVACVIYDKGKQQGTTFNRNLVGNILHLMAERKVLTTDNATELTIQLEEKSEHSVRAKLGEMPAADVKRIIEALVAQKEKEN